MRLDLSHFCRIDAETIEQVCFGYSMLCFICPIPRGKLLMWFERALLPKATCKIPQGNLSTLFLSQNQILLRRAWAWKSFSASILLLHTSLQWVRRSC